MLDRRAKVGILVACLLVLAVEGVFLVRHYDRYYGSEAVSGTTAASSAPSAFEGTMPEGTAPEQTAPEQTTGEEAVPPDAETMFAHTATDENSRGDYTYIGDPAIDGDPNSVIIVEADADRDGDSETTYDHNIGVWYDFVDRKRWAIFNQDRAAVPNGATFRVILPLASDSLVHRARVTNTVGHITYLDDPLTNGQPDAVLSITQNWNPGGGVGVYNDHPVGVLYDEDVEKWAIYNLDNAPMPEGSAFNVAVAGGVDSAG